MVASAFFIGRDQPAPVFVPVFFHVPRMCLHEGTAHMTFIRIPKEMISIVMRQLSAVLGIREVPEKNPHGASVADEVMKIQAEGREKRALAEQEMSRMENELKQKLLEVRAKKA